MRGINAFRKDALSGIRQFGALLVEHIAQTEIKLQLGHEFEKRQIDLAAHTYLQAGIERLRAQQRMLARRQVIKGRNAEHHVGAIVVEARRRHFEIDGQANVGRLHILRLLFART